MSGFRKTANVTRSRPIPRAEGVDTTPGSAPSITSRIIAALNHGGTRVSVARDLGLPAEFVDMVIERACRDGRLSFFELCTGNCSSSGCSPDPDSPVCAGCPLYPAASRRDARANRIAPHSAENGKAAVRGALRSLFH